MKGGPQVGEVTCHMLPHLPGVPHLHVNKPLVYKNNNNHTSWVQRFSLMYFSVKSFPISVFSNRIPTKEETCHQQACELH